MILYRNGPARRPPQLFTANLGRARASLGPDRGDAGRARVGPPARRSTEACGRRPGCPTSTSSVRLEGVSFTYRRDGDWRRRRVRRWALWTSTIKAGRDPLRLRRQRERQDHADQAAVTGLYSLPTPAGSCSTVEAIGREGRERVIGPALLGRPSPTGTCFGDLQAARPLATSTSGHPTPSCIKLGLDGQSSHVEDGAVLDDRPLARAEEAALAPAPSASMEGRPICHPRRVGRQPGPRRSRRAFYLEILPDLRADRQDPDRHQPRRGIPGRGRPRSSGSATAGSSRTPPSCLPSPDLSTETMRHHP